tara:strand:- start:135 stop:599 length:465 start_codon:yes stop_codon:yes gene_type:complete
MLIRLENNAPVDHPVDDYNFRALFPAVSFPRILTPSDVEPYGYGMYEYSQQPSLEKYQKRVEGTPVKREDGIWYQVWEIETMSADEQTAADNKQARKMRDQRSALLAFSDWSVLTDSPLTTAKKTAWKTYRQELRDITSQSGFPWDISWPVEPS